MVYAFILILIAIMVIISYFDVNFPRVNKIEILSPKSIGQNSIRILQISDYHNSKHNDFVLKNIKRLMPDIIVITGDLIDESTESYTNVYKLVEEVARFNPKVYFVNGNHEWKNGNIRNFLQGLADRKIRIMNNKNVTINLDDCKINICGIDDFHTKHSDFQSAIQGIDERNFTVMLSHSPDAIESLNHEEIDLVLSGHTHGGQIRLPLLGAIIAPGQGIFPKYSKGIYKFGKDSLLYIDSGMGFSRVPIRLFNRSQMSLITVRGKVVKHK